MPGEKLHALTWCFGTDPRRAGRHTGKYNHSKSSSSQSELDHWLEVRAVSMDLKAINLDGLVQKNASIKGR